MKQIIMLAIVLTTIAGSAFSNTTSSINKKAVSSFSKSFHDAQDVRWEVKNNLFKVSFKTGGKEMYAYYNSEGDQVALSRNIHTDQLPLSLYNELKLRYDQSWLTELFEVSANGETAYYATIENATHITILKADGTADWSVFSKEKRK